MSETLVCKANINAAGRRRRTRVGLFSVAACVALLVSFVVSGAHPIVRLTLFFPAFMAAVGLLQVRRNTCVALAAMGKREGDRGLEAAPEQEVLASRRVGNTIYRDGLLLALAAALLAFATGFIG